MKISKETTEILKNFATINSGLAFKKGSNLRTISPQKNVLAIAKISETMPRDFVIYDLNQFLTTVSAFQEPEINFEDKQAIIGDDTSKAYYTYASAETVTQVPEKTPALPSVDISFVLDESAMQAAIRMAGILAVPDVALIGREGKAYLSAIDSANGTGHRFERVVGDANNNYRIIYRVDNLKFLPRDYEVRISAKGISHFKSKKDDVEYYIAAEIGSTFDK